MIRDLLEKIASTASLYPDRTAIVDENRSRTYKEFSEAIAAATQELAASGLEPGDRVGLRLENSFDACVYVCASLAQGLTYVPLAPKDPVNRIQTLLRISGAKLLIGRFLEAELRAGAVQILDLANTKRSSGASASAPIFRKSGEDPVLYLLFTSGTTGNPKGVLITESNVRHFCTWAIQKFDVCETDVFLGHINLTFDLSVFHLFVPFLVGASVRITPPTLEKIAPVGQLQKGVTIAFLVPRMTDLLEGAGFLKGGDFPDLRHVLFCGERLRARQVRSWQNGHPKLKVHNLYGPTEATVACSCYSFEPGQIPRDPIPIGTPIGDTEFFLRDGELLISGSQVMKYEYLIDGPRAKPRGARPYSSGDLVEVDSEGTYRWVSRIDDQVKIQGHRVEIAEIESKLKMSDRVRDVVCVFDGASETLAAFFTLIPSAEEKSAILEFQRICRTELPSYMHPTFFMSMASLPLTQNGKTDEKSLRSEIQGWLRRAK